MTARTETEAKLSICPVTRGSQILGEPCVASACMAWRWQPLIADAAFMTAVEKAAKDIGDTSPQRAKAAKHVTAHRAEYGLPEKPFRGYCGLAGSVHPHVKE